MNRELYFRYLCLVRDGWNCVEIVCVSDYKVETVVVWIVGIGYPVVGWRVYERGEVKAIRKGCPLLFDVNVFDHSHKVEIITGWLLLHDRGCGIIGWVLGGEGESVSSVVVDDVSTVLCSLAGDGTDVED
jgi:hypothetical protein